MRFIDADKIEISAERGISDNGLIFIPMRDVQLSIDATPTADVVEVKHGYNIDFEYPSLFQCSVCGASDGDTYTGDGEYNYCPWCGAKMDGERKEE